VLMRQEKTMKVIANHVVDPRIELAPNAGSDRSWVWSVFDFSEGDLVEEVFALRFGTCENAHKFLDAFVEAQAEMTKLCAGEDAAPDAAADEAAAALEALTASDEVRPTADERRF
jgi:Ran-binding protein 1